ncbi:hypothetical protein RN001_008374 [Aquatica leii]|uniref:Uncharacterized protein n=1 Tax=Aquatica leii TaxID=1421715 RepID=A0AAN7SP79_9COLE|nr:hypothetical protein RN001_008374 [Aquatica leii]
MGKLTPVLAACALNSSGVYIFRTPANLECFPYSAYLMFLASVFYLLWNVPLNPYPSCFRDLAHPASLVLESLVATLLIEVVMTDFWCPLQTKFVTFVPTIPDEINEISNFLGVDATALTDCLEFLKTEEATTAASYALSSFFLVCTMHTTRVVDLRLMRCGLDVFILDITKRSQNFAKSIVQMDWYKRRGGCRPSLKCTHRRRSTSCSDWTAESDSIESDSQYIVNYNLNAR